MSPWFAISLLLTRYFLRTIHTTDHIRHICKVGNCGWVYHGKGGDTRKRNENGIRITENLKNGPQRHWCWSWEGWSGNGAVYDEQHSCLSAWFIRCVFQFIMTTAAKCHQWDVMYCGNAWWQRCMCLSCSMLWKFFAAWGYK